MQGNRILDHDAIAVPVISGMESEGVGRLSFRWSFSRRTLGDFNALDGASTSCISR